MILAAIRILLCKFAAIAVINPQDFGHICTALPDNAPFTLLGGPDSGLSANPTERLVARAKAAALSDNTRKTYRTGWRSWATWARARGLKAFPAASEHLLSWLATLFEEGKKPSTMSTYLAAVAHRHRDHIGANPARRFEVRQLLSGLFRQAANDGYTPRQADPLCKSHIERIIAAAHKPRSNQPGGRLETHEQARRRGDTDIAMNQPRPPHPRRPTPQDPAPQTRSRYSPARRRRASPVSFRAISNRCSTSTPRPDKANYGPWVIDQLRL